MMPRGKPGRPTPHGPLRLSTDLTDSPQWRALRQIMEAQLAQLRNQNDTMVSPEQTAFLRGKISCLKDLLVLEQRPRTEGDPLPPEFATEPAPPTP